ncbi:hypothetical protein M2368_003465 [Arthrobacter sp. JUb119]|uniref:hypothetical protein n=1 Tax=Arthrobacter sp. JUb115 TaxID=2485108 RepID=UPI00105D04C1|nr:hypothetical protein [Arthrobacter sp. JUb115]MCS3494433.1 hypothetical protein [Arthrobacter sp. JUb119]TDU22526.1 hypothetical protein EDF61_10956 [Arthrobacter sp. JUb115]
MVSTYSKILLSSILFGVCLTESLAARTYRTEIEVAISSGAGIVVARADGGIDNELCKRTENISGVETVGMLYKKESLPSNKAPGTLLTVSKVDGNFMLIVFEKHFDPATKYTVTEELIKEIGETKIKFPGDREPQALNRVTSTPISEGMNRWVFQEYRSTSDVAECWIKISPAMQTKVIPLLSSFFHEIESLSLEKVSDTDIESIEKRWSQRQSQYYWVAAGVLTGLIASLCIFIRRHEFFLYMTLGFRRHESTIVAVIEIFLIQLFALILAFSILSAVSPLMGFVFYDFAIGVTNILQTFYLGISCSLILCFIITSGKQLKNMKRDT